jgi:hypothetical protein
LFSSDDVIDTFFKWKPPIFFLNSDSPFNCLNDSVKILLSYIRKFLRKKIIKLEKINFITNKNKSKNEVGKSNSQMLLSISFVCVIFVLQNVFENDSFNRNTTYRNFNFDWMLG